MTFTPVARHGRPGLPRRLQRAAHPGGRASGGGNQGPRRWLGRRPQGSVAWSRCATTLAPRYTIFTKRFGASVSEATMRPNPRRPLAAERALLPRGRRRWRARRRGRLRHMARGAPGALARPVVGPVALSLCTTAHLFYTRFTNIFGAFISEATMRPDPSLATGRAALLLQAALLC
jgi:hypothetical protein